MEQLDLTRDNRSCSVTAPRLARLAGLAGALRGVRHLGGVSQPEGEHREEGQELASFTDDGVERRSELDLHDRRKMLKDYKIQSVVLQLTSRPVDLERHLDSLPGTAGSGWTVGRGPTVATAETTSRHQLTTEEQREVRTHFLLSSALLHSFGNIARSCIFIAIVPIATFALQ